MSTVSREKGATFCPIHSKKKLVFLCKQCDILICNKCMVKEHSGHPVEEVEEVAEQKFIKLDEFITKTEDTTIPRAQRNVEQVEAQVSTRVKELEAEIEKAYQHEELLIELVGNNRKIVVDQLKGDIKTINHQLYQFKSESDTYLNGLKSTVNECKETKKTNNDISIIDVFNCVEQISDHPPSCQILQTRQKFNPGSNPVADIAKVYGCTSKESAISRQLLSQTQVTLCKDLKSLNPCSIENFSHGTLCYCCVAKPFVYLIDKSGNMKKIKLDVSVLDIAIHPTTDVLYSLCLCENRIWATDINTGTSYIVFTTIDAPSCMTFTGDGTILVGFYMLNKIVNYTLSGDVLKEIDDVQDPLHISVCNITGNIVIAASDSGIQVMNKDFQTMFVFKGPKEKTPSRKAFYCYDAVFDTDGHILVGDKNNKEVHIVDANSGKHLKTINSDKFGDIRCLCFHKDHGLVVGTDSPNKLVFVKYMQQL